MRRARVELDLGRRVAVEEALGEAHAPGLGARRPTRAASEPVVTSSVEPPPMSITRVPAPSGAVGGDAAQHQLRLLATVEQARREAVAPLDLAEERLAVVRVADGARPDGEDALGAERLGLAPIVDEHVADAGDRGGEEDAAPVDRLAEPRDHPPAHDLVQQAVLDVGDEQAGGVGAEVDGGDSHAHTVLR